MTRKKKMAWIAMRATLGGGVFLVHFPGGKSLYNKLVDIGDDISHFYRYQGMSTLKVKDISSLFEAMGEIEF